MHVTYIAKIEFNEKPKEDQFLFKNLKNLIIARIYTNCTLNNQPRKVSFFQPNSKKYKTLR
jgi:hypothetical protein